MITVAGIFVTLELLLIICLLCAIVTATEAMSRKIADLHEASQLKAQIVEDGPLKLKIETYREPLDKSTDTEP